MAEVSDNDIWILSYYRESELAGSLVMGRLSQETDDDALRAKLTEHCAEEARHASLWSDTIIELGALPRRVRETYQTRYHERLGDFIIVDGRSGVLKLPRVARSFPLDRVRLQ